MKLVYSKIDSLFTFSIRCKIRFAHILTDPINTHL